MKKNMGSTDKIVRYIIAVIVAILYFTNTISGTLALVLGSIALIFVITSLINFCPIWAIFGTSTRKTK